MQYEKFSLIDDSLVQQAFVDQLGYAVLRFLRSQAPVPLEDLECCEECR